MRALLIPVVIPLFIVAAYFGWSWYQVKNFMDLLVKDAAPFATITYESIPIAYKGQYSVKGIEIDPFNSGLTTRIEELKLTSGDWHLMALKGTPLDSGDWPNSMSLQLTNLAFDSEATVESNPLVAIMLEQPVLVGCSKSDGQPVVMRDLGMGVLNSDVSAAYAFNPESQIANIVFESSTAKMGTASFGMDFELNGKTLNQNALQLNAPQLLAVTLDYLDQGYNRLLVDHCAKQAGVSSDEFLQQLASSTKAQAEQLGLAIPDSILALYPEALKPGASYKAAIDFKQPLPLGKSATNVDVGQLMESVDVKMTLNKQTLELNDIMSAIAILGQSAASGGYPQPSLGYDPSESMASVIGQEGVSGQLQEQQIARIEAAATAPSSPSVGNPSSSSLSKSPEKTSAAAPAKPKPPEYKEISVSQVSQSVVGKQIKINTYNGRFIEGEVLRVLNNRMIVRQQIGTGTADIPLMFKNAARIQVK